MTHVTLTKHAEIRFRQRGIREEVLECLERFGEARDEPCGATKIILPRKRARRAVKDLKKVIRALEHGCDITLLDDGCRVITGYRRK